MVAGQHDFIRVGIAGVSKHHIIVGASARVPGDSNLVRICSIAGGDSSWNGRCSRRMDHTDGLHGHPLVTAAPGHGIGMTRVRIPGVTNVDCGTIITVTDDRMPLKVDHHGVPGVNLGFEIVK
ncbi:MAG: hypothetical protein BWX85_00813 [Chloroflexi bacterium ADurb.Bin120]|nr:MAG: hypothetical protein BWX85_00813 [Chloroflexi bacterium ADurb.Bin120]